MRAAVLVAIAGLSGCSLFLGSDTGAKGDGGVGADGDPGQDGGELYAAWGVTVDGASLSGEWTAPAGCVIDTDAATAVGCDASGAQLRGAGDKLVIEASRVTVAGPIQLVGERALVIITRQLEVAEAGQLDAIGTRRSGVTAPAYCDTGFGAIVVTGAGGGGFGSNGAEGGGGSKHGTTVPLTELLGAARGCPGGGGAGETPEGGNGVQLIATQTAQIAGKIFAHGASGPGGLANTGGGGGGSGGMIAIDSPSIHITSTAELAAHGGSGGSGGTTTGVGEPGQTEPGFVCAIAGPSVEGSGVGGVGACSSDQATLEPAQIGGDAQSGGHGGGGGGFGYVLFHGDPEPRVESVRLSPAPVVID